MSDSPRMRTENEIRAEIERLKAQVRASPHKRSDMEAVAASLLVSALSWAVGDIEGTAIRVKIRGTP